MAVSTESARIDQKGHMEGQAKDCKKPQGPPLKKAKLIATPEVPHESSQRTPLELTPPSEEAQPTMYVEKRDGSYEPVDVNKIIKAVNRCATDLSHVDPLRVATRTIGGLYDKATTKELDKLCIKTAADFISEEPEYSKLAARLLSHYIGEEVRCLGVRSFSEAMTYGKSVGVVSANVAKFAFENRDVLNAAINPDNSLKFEYFGLRTVYDRYLLKDPTSRDVYETPQYFFMRVACGLANTVEEVIEFYRLMSSLDYLPSSPTLFNSATHRSQLSSCYLLESPEDDLKSIYNKYSDIAMLSKYAGGIGLAYHKVRSRGSLIKGTNGHSNGIVPWLKTLDSSVAAVNQGGRRKGACCVYLETWHADIEEFLELRDNTGDEARRTHNINLANWIPDLFMKRVESDGMWSLFDPKEVPEFPDLFGEAFERAFVEAEKEGRFVKQISARELYSRMMKTLAQTGNGWMTFKDSCNEKCNQTGKSGQTVHLSNLCTEIVEVTTNRETAVCNLGSINLSHHVRKYDNGELAFDFVKLGKSVRTAVKYLDRVIDINFYPIPTAKNSNRRWRPVGLGAMGLQDVYFKLKVPFDSKKGRALSSRIQEEIYYHALTESCTLARELGAHPSFKETRASDGILQFDLWGVVPNETSRWDLLRRKIKKYGLRNSLMIAIAPTATIASIAGCVESIEPQVSNLFKRETLSGEFMQINRYLIGDLKELGLWTPEVRAQLKQSEGSIQQINEIPERLKEVYRTAWEIPMRSLIDMAADRAAFIDQSHSLNLFMESPTIGKLSSMYFHAWKRGLKTTYYMRSRPATKIRKTDSGGGASYPSSNLGNVSGNQEVPSEASEFFSRSQPGLNSGDAAAIACSLENPETCESCQ